MPVRLRTLFGAIVTTWIVLGVLTWGFPARAGNPDLRWRTLETEHFYIHYAVGQEEAAERTAISAERAYDTLSVSWGHRVFLKTHISLTDSTDLANGSATSVPFPRIVANVTAPESLSVLEAYDDWIDVLITHELVHVVHLDTVHGIPRLINAVTGFGVLGKIMAPNIVQPRWMIEGVATYEESDDTGGGRGTSAQFDMFLRMAVLEGQFQTIDQVSSGARIWPHGSAVYLHGLHFMRYIASRYGQDKLAELSHVYGGQIVPLGINRAIRKVLGVDFYRLWKEFRRDTERQFRSQARRIRARGLRAGRRLTFSGEITRYPFWSPDGDHIYYYGDDGHRRGGIRHVPLVGSRVREGRGIGREGTSVDEKLVAQVSGASAGSFARAGGAIVVDMGVVHDLRYRWSELHLWEGGDPRKLTRLTFGNRASEPHVAPDGRTVVFRRNDAAQSRLGFLDLATGDVTEVPHTERIAQVYTPRWAPDGNRVAYSGWREGGYRDIYIFDRASGEHQRVTADRYLDLAPSWTPDGRYVLFTSDRDDVQNVYAYEVETGIIRQVSNVLGGAFEPMVSPDGEYVAYVGYGANGYDIWVMDFDPDKWLPVMPPVTDLPPAHSTNPQRGGASPTTLDAKRYRAIKTFFPRAIFPTAFDVQSSGFGTELGIELGITDVLGFHTLIGRFAYLLAPFNQPVGSAAYVLDRLFPTFILGLSRGFALRNGFTRYEYDYDVLPQGSDTGYLVTGYRESIVTVDGTVRVPVYRHSRYSVNAQARYRFTHIVNLDAEAGSIDPNAPISRLPEVGDIAQVDLNLGYDSQEGARFGYGSQQGNRLSVGLTIIDEALGGDFGDLQVRVDGEQNFKMPWRGHQVLALRASGGASAGGIRRRGAFFVGGYPEEQDVFRSLLARTPFGTGGILRGYRRGQFGGRYFFVGNMEYRIPLADVDRGLGTLPMFLRRVVLIPHSDVGSAWTAPIQFSDLHWSAGGALVFSFRMGYLENIELFLDYAHGFDDETGLNVFRAIVARSF